MKFSIISLAFAATAQAFYFPFNIGEFNPQQYFESHPQGYPGYGDYRRSQYYYPPQQQPGYNGFYPQPQQQQGGYYYPQQQQGYQYPPQQGYQQAGYQQGGYQQQPYYDAATTAPENSYAAPTAVSNEPSYVNPELNAVHTTHAEH